MKNEIVKSEAIEKALRKSENKYRRIFENTLTPYYELSSDGILLEISPSVERYLKYKREELIGKSSLSLFAEAEQWDFLTGKLLESKKFLGEDMLLKDKDGSILNILVWAKYIQEDKKIVGSLFDISEYKKVEEDLRKLSSAVRQSPSPVVITDLTGTIEYVNPEFEKLTGYSLDEAVGNNPSILKSGEHSNEFYKELWDKITVGGEWSGIFHNKKKNGELYWEETTITSIKDNNGKIINYLAVKKDITEQRKAEEQIKASLDEKETLLEEVHHRVKNNMAVISSLLKLQADNAEDRHIKEALMESQNRIYAMSAVHETLHGSKNISEIDLKTYLNKIITSVFQTSSVNVDKIKLSYDIEEIPVSVNQASPLGLIINELISNSLKYAFPDERKGEIHVSLKKPNKKLELTVMDNGIGISDELDCKNVCTLGLKLVYTLVENQLGGSIHNENKNGAKFIIKFNTDKT